MPGVPLVTALEHVVGVRGLLQEDETVLPLPMEEQNALPTLTLTHKHAPITMFVEVSSFNIRVKLNFGVDLLISNMFAC